jgi:tetratricopeptide (TPR) repeat protein
MWSFLKITLLFLWTVPALGILQSDDSNQFDSLLIAAQKAQARGDYAAAANSYRQAVTINGDNPELWANLGLMENEPGNYSEAIQSFQNAARLNPSLYVPNLFLGIDYVHTGKPEKALPFLLKAERLNATDPQAPLALGRAYSSLGSFTEAVQAYTRAVDLNPQDSSAWFALGVSSVNQVEAEGRKMSAEGRNSSYAKALLAASLAEQARPREAIEQYKDLIATNPQPPCMHSALGIVYLQQHDDEDAKSEFMADLQQGQACALATLGQARQRMDAGSEEGAVALFKMLWTRDSGFLRSNASRIVSGLSSDQFSKFADYLNQQHDTGKIETDLYGALSSAFRGTPQLVGSSVSAGDASTKRPPANQSSAVASHLADAYYQAGRYGLCASHLAGGLATENSNQLLLLATCSWMTGDYELSARASSKLEARNPHSLAALYWSVQAHEELALAAFSRFEQLEPNSERTHLLLGDMYRQSQRFDRAEEEYKQASTLAPNDPAPLFGLASAYFRDSKMDEALAVAQTALAMSPNNPELNLVAAEILVSRRQWAQAESFLKKSLTAKPQMLPHVHVLLGEVYEETGRTQEATVQLQMGVASDEDGSVYYRLARLYNKVGNKAAAEVALAHVKALEEKRREGAVIAIQDPAVPPESAIP